MGEVLQFNPLGWREDLAPGTVEEVEHIATIHGVRVSIASQDEAHPGHLHVTVSDEGTGGATGVAVVPDTDDGRRLGRFVARAVIRAIDAVSWVPRQPDGSPPQDGG